MNEDMTPAAPDREPPEGAAEDEAEALRRENAALTRRLEELRKAERDRERSAAMEKELAALGADPQAAELLMLAARARDAELEDIPALAGQLRERYGGFFLREVREGTPRVTPPGGGERYTRDTLRHMTTEQINTLWSGIRGALSVPGD